MIAVIFALEFESAFFKAHAKSSPDVEIWLLGITGHHAGPAMSRQIEEAPVKPDVAISAGFAGALQDGLGVGDLVLGTNFTDASLADRLHLGTEWKRGDVYTTPAMASTAEEKRRLGVETGAMVVDMETSHVHEACRAHGIPMVSVRCVSDMIDDTLPVPPEILLNPETGRPDPFGLFKHFVTRPQSIGPFNTLLKNARTAQGRIASGLKEITDQLGSSPV